MNAPAIRSVSLLASLLLATTGLADWPAYLNGNDRTGFSDGTLNPSLKLAWTYKSPAKPIKAWAGPREAPIEGHALIWRPASRFGISIPKGRFALLRHWPTETSISDPTTEWFIVCAPLTVVPFGKCELDLRTIVCCLVVK